MQIAYVGAFEFPDGEAGAGRVTGIGCIFRDLGHEVVFMGIEKNARGRSSSAIVHDSESATDRGFRSVSAEYGSNSIFRRLIRLFSIYSGTTFVNRLNAELALGRHLDVLIAYQLPITALRTIRRWSIKRKIPLVYDVVEWFDKSHLPLGRFGPFALESELRMRTLPLFVDGIIVISEFLKHYYSHNRVPVIRIPPLVDLRSEKWQHSVLHFADRPLSLVYAGMPGKKDLLANAIRGLHLLGQEGRKCTFTIIGPSRKQIYRSFDSEKMILDDLSDQLCFTGRIPHREVLSLVGKSDYSVLLRPRARFSHAGFSTKLVESLAMGVPVICNLTGDMGQYVHDGKEGIVLDGAAPKSFANGVRRALSLSHEECTTMRHCALATARLFDYRGWLQPMHAFLQQVMAVRARSASSA